MAYKTVLAVVVLVVWVGGAVAQSSDRDMFLKAYPLCFELYSNEASIEHKTCIELSARYASGYDRQQLSAAVQRHLEERKRAADC